MIKSAPLPPPMAPTTITACRHLDRIAEAASWLHEQTKLSDRGIAPAFGIDMNNPEQVDWLSDIAIDLVGLWQRANCIGDYATGGRLHDARSPR